MSAAFTPGPWEAVNDIGVVNAGERQIAAVLINGDVSQREANANLIASAPSLYADAEFLCARVRELESDLSDDATARQYYGHVVPALARMESCLSEARGEQS